MSLRKYSFRGCFSASNYEETLAGRIVLSIGCDTKSDAMLLAEGTLTPALKPSLIFCTYRKSIWQMKFLCST